MRSRPIALATLLAAMTLTAPPASAGTELFTNPASIKIGDVPSQPSTSSIDVQGQSGKVVGVSVTLHRFNHKQTGAVDVLLVSPDGDTSLVMSDACRLSATTNATWVFGDLAPAPMPMQGACGDILYRPTDYPAGSGDGFGANGPKPPYKADFNRFLGGSPNGTWTLWVSGSDLENTGKIAAGWSLTLESAVPDAVVESRLDHLGAADPYPITRSAGGIDGVITDLDVAVTGVYHQKPTELNMLLVGPRGQKAVLMTGACGGSSGARNQSWVFDDEAISPMGPYAACPDGRYRPSNHAERIFPQPAPILPVDAKTSLSDFDLLDPNGEWQLYVYDNAFLNDFDGLFTQRFTLDIKTRPRAKVAFAEPAVDVPEGQTRTLTLTRSAGKEPLGPGTVTLTSTPLSATAGSDFKSVSATVEFAAGQKEKTVSVEALADALAEEAERFALTIGSATGDADPATPPTAVVTIPDTTPRAAASEAPPAGGGPGPDAGAGAPDAGAGPGADRDAPVIGGLALSRTAVRYALSEPATVTLKLQRRTGRRYVTARMLRCAGRAGANRVAVRLRRGTYRVTATAADATGNRSPALRKTGVAR